MVGEGRRHKYKHFYYYSFSIWGLNPRKSSFLDLHGQEDSLSRSCLVPVTVQYVEKILPWLNIHNIISLSGGLWGEAFGFTGGFSGGWTGHKSTSELPCASYRMVPWVMEFVSPPKEFGLVSPYLLVLWLVGCGVEGRVGFPVRCLCVHPREGEKERLLVKSGIPPNWRYASESIAN